MTQRFTDRVGREIHDGETIRALALLRQFRRLNTIGSKAGKPLWEAVTVAELARAAKMSAAQVVEIIRDYDAWYWGLTESGPMESWFVWEDGE